VQWNQGLQIIPRAFFPQKTNKIIIKCLNAISNQTQLNYNTRSSENKNLLAVVPFALSLNDTTIQSNDVMIRNVFSLFQPNPIYGYDFTFVRSTSKILLVNGFDQRNRASLGHKWRYNYSRNMTSTLDYTYANNAYYSPLFSSKNFYIKEQKIEPLVSLQVKQNIKISTSYTYLKRNNGAAYGNEKFLSHKGNVRFRYSNVDQGSVNIDVSVVQVKYNGELNKPVSYNMLEGLQAGNNYLWTVGVDRKILKNLLLNFSYDGRKTGKAKTVHVARMQFSAIF
jgi:hypothetical protein